MSLPRSTSSNHDFLSLGQIKIQDFVGTFDHYRLSIREEIINALNFGINSVGAREYPANENAHACMPQAQHIIVQPSKFHAPSLPLLRTITVQSPDALESAFLSSWGGVLG